MIADMRALYFPLIIGLVVGAFFSFALAAAFIFYLRDGGVGQDAIANFIGVGLGASVTVLGAHFLEEWKRSKLTAAYARLILARLLKVEASLAECLNLIQSAKGKKLSTLGGNVLAVATRARGAITEIELIQMNFGTSINEIIVPAEIIRAALEVSVKIIENDLLGAATALNGYFTNIGRPNNIVGSGAVRGGLDAVVKIQAICKNYI